MSAIFQAVTEATEEAVYNSMFRAPTTTGHGHTIGALPIEKTVKILKEYGMIQRRLRVVKWLTTTPALAVCTLCGREFKVPMDALRRTADAQASLQGQFDRHKCGPEDSSQAEAQTPADVLLRQQPDEEEEDEDEDDDDRKEDNDEIDEEGDGYSE